MTIQAQSITGFRCVIPYDWRAAQCFFHNGKTDQGCFSMPILSIFFGIVVRMWHDDHPPPHIHVEYQGFEALVSIESGEVTQGRFPPKAAAIVKEWCLRHQDELRTNWVRAQHFEPLERIQGADHDD